VIDVNALDKIVHETIKTLENGKQDVLVIAENTSKEYRLVERELEQTNREVNRIINELERLKLQEKESRVRLMDKHRRFAEEMTIKKAYDTTERLQKHIKALQKKEESVRLKRDSLQRSLRQLKDTIEKAEHLTARISIASQYLRGDLYSVVAGISEVQQMQKLGIHLLEAQENECQRISHEIHDGPVQSLGAILLKTELCLKLIDSEPEKVKQELQNLQKLVRSVLRNLRQIIFDLRPALIDDFGLKAGLERYIEEFKKYHFKNVEVRFLNCYKRTYTNIEVAAFRIIQESLNNAGKHAHCSNIVARIEMLSDRLVISVKDDGIGFNPEEVVAAARGFGLQNIKERVKLLQGNLKITSEHGKGTTVFVSIPVEQWFGTSTTPT